MTLAHTIDVPKEWRGGSEQPWQPDVGPIHRYVEAYDRGWWNAVERHMTNIDYQDTFESGVPTAIGWIEEVQGFTDGYWGATERLEQLKRAFGKQKVSEYLQQWKPTAPPGNTAAVADQRSEEIIPAGTFPFPNLDIHQILLIYAELTGKKLDVEEQVRQLPVLIRFEKTYEAMTRAQAREVLEKALRDQAGVVVTHPDTNHVVFRLRQ